MSVIAAQNFTCNSNGSCQNLPHVFRESTEVQYVVYRRFANPSFPSLPLPSFSGEAMENWPSSDSAVLCVPGEKGVVGQQQRPGAAGQGEAIRSERKPLDLF